MRREACSNDSIYIGTAWAGNSVNAVAFRSHGILTQGEYTYATFYDPSGNIRVVKVRLGDKEVEEYSIPVGILPTDAHRALSLGLDSNKRIHLAWGAHNSSLVLAYSLTGALKDGFSDPYVFDDDKAYTYPVFLQFTGCENPLLLLRSGRFDSAEIIVKRLDIETYNWVGDATPLIDGRQGGWTAGPYIDIPGIVKNNNIEITYCWRLSPLASSAGLVGNIGIDYFSSLNLFDTLVSSSGVILSKPVTPASSQRIFSVPLGDSLMNQTSCASSTAGNFFLATIWNDHNGCPQYHLVWRKGKRWACSCLTNFTTNFFLSGKGTLPLPHSRPKILVDEEEIVYLLWRSVENSGRLALSMYYPPCYSRDKSSSIILWDEDLGHYEPVVDCGAWVEHKLLFLYIQSCRFFSDNNSASIGVESEARILRWSLAQIQEMAGYKEYFA